MTYPIATRFALTYHGRPVGSGLDRLHHVLEHDVRRGHEAQKGQLHEAGRFPESEKEGDPGNAPPQHGGEGYASQPIGPGSDPHAVRTSARP